MKIIFLDIDGVLNVMSRGHDDYGSFFHPHLVENFKRVIDETGAKIVISSTWRMSGFEIMKEMWAHRNLPGEVIGITGYGGGSIFTRGEDDKASLSIPRGSEIRHWLHDRDETGEQRYGVYEWMSKEDQIEQFEKQSVKSFVIIDDDNDMLIEQQPHFVQTSQRWKEEDSVDGYGLTSKAADEAIWILNKPERDLEEERRRKSRCCYRCDGVSDICFTDMTCEPHNVMGCWDCWPDNE